MFLAYVVYTTYVWVLAPIKESGKLKNHATQSDVRYDVLPLLAHQGNVCAGGSTYKISRACLLGFGQLVAGYFASLEQEAVFLLWS
jgi:hypothetical protein